MKENAYSMTMEKCMVAASVALLVCHPNSNIKCSNPRKTRSPLPKGGKHSTLDVAKRRRQQQQSPRCVQQHKGLKCEHLKAMPHFKVVYASLEEPGKCSLLHDLEGILRQGWNPNRAPVKLMIKEVLKVKHKERVIEKFERYREMVKEKASKIVTGRGGEKINKYYHKKLLDDGFELLCFFGARLACGESMLDGVRRSCRKKCCGVCRLIKVIGSSTVDGLHSVSVCETGWMAHLKAVKECQDEEGSSEARKAILVCRVIAGRIADYGCQQRGDCGDVKIGEDDKYDSAFVPVNCGSQDELLVYNPCAILPCFVVLYDVEDL